MFFNLEYIPHHPCNKMQEVIETFFGELINNTNFGVHLFPEWFQPTINRSPALRKKFKGIFDNLHKKNQNFRQHIHDQLINNNYIEDICDKTDFHFLNHLNWDSKIGKEVKTFFEKILYAALDQAVFKPNGCMLKPKKSFYNEFIEKNKHVCPFCGMERYPNPRGKTRSDLDHYLNKTAYPFSAANLKNLVPMCDRCNRDYKKAKDMVKDGANRTQAFYPYGEIPVIHLIIICGTEPVNIGDTGSWNISLNTDDQTAMMKIDTWDRVFEIKEKIRQKIEEFFRCMAHNVSDIFLKSYLVSFNHRLKQAA